MELNTTSMGPEALMTGLGVVWFHPLFQGCRRLLYLISPAETTFETAEEVPNYLSESVPYFMVFLAIDVFLRALQGRPHLRLNDAYGSAGSGLLVLVPGIFFKNIEFTSYIWGYENFRLVDLPWDSLWTWLAAFLGADLGYYWMHRISHESNFFWAAHQVHHSSQEYNITTALRNSALRRHIAWVFNLPFCLFVPPSAYLVHMQINLAYQLWVHTETIGSLGPLEYIISTPSTHRVHHGRNRYCIDKNYGGVLMIWDVMFGTFVKEGEKVVFGITTPLETWDPIEISVGYWRYMWNTFWSRDNWSDSFATIWKGPGWAPGKPRTGYLEDIPDVHYPMPKFDKKRPLWMNIYCIVHLGLGFACAHAVDRMKMGFDPLTNFFCMMFLLWTVSAPGVILDDRRYAPAFELARCLTFLAADFAVRDCAEIQNMTLIYIARIVFIISANIWAGYCAQQWKAKHTKTE